MKQIYVNVVAPSGAVTAGLEGQGGITSTESDALNPRANQNSALYALIDSALSIEGRVTYTLTVENGKLIQLSQVSNPDTGPKTARHLTMRQAAEIMHHSYDWLSRNYKRLGLHPTNYGYPLLFDAQEIEDCMKRNVKSYRGRPRKNLYE
jgi:hypothetical protein